MADFIGVRSYLFFKISAKYLMCLAIMGLTTHSLAADLDMPGASREQIRNQIRSCKTLFVTPDQKDDSVGIPFSVRNLDQFRAELKTTLAQFGREKFRDGTFYILGVKMQDQAQSEQNYRNVLREFALDEVNAHVTVLSVPSQFIEKESVNLATHALQRLRYFFPSLARDYQKPQRAEVGSGWAVNALIEVPNIFVLFVALPPLDATLTVATHAALLGAYSIYAQSMLNWLRRPGSGSEKMNHIELFLKQMALGVPFVMNYSVFGRFSEILNFYMVHGWQQTLHAFPYELTNFASTQGLTLALQTVFYSQVITNGYGGWVGRQTGDENSRVARAVRPWLQVPVLAAGAITLAAASSNWTDPILAIGPMTINAGHFGLVGLTAAGIFYFKKFPKVMDHTIPIYQSIERMWQQIRPKRRSQT
jgi:hypothetical protein